MKLDLRFLRGWLYRRYPAISRGWYRKKLAGYERRWGLEDHGFTKEGFFRVFHEKFLEGKRPGRVYELAAGNGLVGSLGVWLEELSGGWSVEAWEHRPFPFLFNSKTASWHPDSRRATDKMVSEREKKRSGWHHNKGGTRDCRSLQGSPRRPDPAGMGRPMESDDAPSLVSANEKCGLSARVGLSADGVLCGRGTGVGERESGNGGRESEVGSQRSGVGERGSWEVKREKSE